jgi:FMN phosphatase YigB (HAD superfamily)
VFFDAYNTLMGLGGRLGRGSDACGMYRSVEGLFSRLDARLQAAYGQGRSDASDDPRWRLRAWARVAEKMGLHQNGFAALLGMHPERLIHRLKVYEDTLVTLAELTAFCRLAIISNAWLHLDRLLQLLGIGQYFQSVVVSAQVGLSKPDPAIYRLGLERLGVLPSESIFVDDLPANVLAAQAEGFTALWLVRRCDDGNRIPSRYRGLSRIASLRELVPLAKGP